MHMQSKQQLDSTEKMMLICDQAIACPMVSRHVENVLLQKGVDIVIRGWRKTGISGLLNRSTTFPPLDPFKNI